VNPVTGKATPGENYAARTRRHARAVIRSFYEYHRETHGRPELGQQMFGGPTEQWSVPHYVTALLWGVAEEIARVESNRTQKSIEPPVGWGGEYSTDVFTMRGYDYPEDDDDARPPNFEADIPEVGRIELRWYKRLGRSMSANRSLSPQQWVDVFDACIAAVRATEPPLPGAEE
jgi:hypothetical protein